MDQHEAERLAKAIRILHMDWIEVQAVEYNGKSGTYEVRCAYREKQEGALAARDSWAALLIINPRQWITLLTQRNGGLERS